MNNLLVHPSNIPSLSREKSEDFCSLAIQVRSLFDGLLDGGLFDIAANYAAQTMNDPDGNRVAVIQLIRLLLDKEKVQNILSGTDPLDKQNIITLALAGYRLPDDKILVSETKSISSSPAEARTISMKRRSTPKPPNPSGE